MQIFKMLTLCCALAVSLVAADDPFLGKWKLNTSKSTFAPGQGIKEMTVSFTQEGDQIRRIATGSMENGKPVDEGGPEGDVFRWNGKPHVAREASPRIVITCSPIRNRTTHVTVEINGKLAVKTLAQVSADGQTLTEHTDVYDEQGKISKAMLIFERQP